METKTEANVVNLEERRAKKTLSPALLLRDSKRVARNISTRTCIICSTRKSCVGKAGVCSYCYENVLTSEERKIADEEAKHKIIQIQVIDDRWE